MAGNIHQEKISPISNFYPTNFLSRIDDCTEYMATFTALVKIYSSEYFCDARVAGIGESFVQQKFLAIRYFKQY